MDFTVIIPSDHTAPYFAGISRTLTNNQTLGKVSKTAPGFLES
jgi:hypothetical protein